MANLSGKLLGNRLGGTRVDSPRERLLLRRLQKRTAQVVISMGDFARGLKLLKSSASLDPECPIPYVNAARAYLGMNDLVAARRQAFFPHTLRVQVVLYNRLSQLTVGKTAVYAPYLFLPPSTSLKSDFPVRVL